MVKMIPRALLVGALVCAGTLAGCDTGTTTSDVTVRGRVTDDPSSTLGPVEGAVVTAARVSASGQLQGLDGEATTDADGEYRLETEGATGAVVLTATDGSFSSRVLIEEDGADDGTVTAPPMTAETDAEVAVYLAAKAAGSRATVADVVAFVTANVAAEIDAGANTAAEVAAALDAALDAEAAYAQDAGASAGDVDDAQDNRATAYAAFRTALHNATSADDRVNALRTFEEAYADAWADADVDADVQAEASRAGALAAARFSTDLSADAAFEIERQARLYAATAAALAIEAAFRNENASNDRLTVLSEARLALVAAIRAATSASALAGAEAAYQAAVRAEVAAEAGLSGAEVSAAQSATGSARAALTTAVAAATTAEQVADAVATFYASARTAIEGVLGTDEDFATLVILHLAAFGSLSAA